MLFLGKELKLWISGGGEGQFWGFVRHNKEDLPSRALTDQISK